MLIKKPINKEPVALKPLGLYIHVPFCRSKCQYCDFYSLGGGMNHESMDLYLQAVLAHIKETAQRVVGYTVDTVYFGGGTPSFFGAQNLIRILTEIDRRFHLEPNAEITFEANPDSVTGQSLAKLRKAGFNRISIGVQCDEDAKLKALGRPHTYKQAQMAVAQARRAGFDNVSVDLMFGLPNQNREQWMATLRNVMELKPDHISCYGLKVEPNTPLWEYKEGANLPDDDMQADMYFYAVETLESFGFHQYEISNFALPGKECLHNLKYWTGQPYIGFGPAAASDFGGKRFTAEANLDRYITGVMEQTTILSECETLPQRERAGEYLMLRLRTAHGIEENEYVHTYLLPFAPLEELLHKFAQMDLAEQQENGRWRLTPKGFMVSNSIILELLEAQQQSKPLAKALR